MTLLVVVTSSEATLKYQVAVGKVYRRPERKSAPIDVERTIRGRCSDRAYQCQASSILADDTGSAI